MIRRLRSASLFLSLLVPALVSAQGAPTAAPSSAATVVAADPMRPFVTGTRNFSVGYMALGEYEGHGGGVMFEKGMLSFSPRLHVGIGAFAGVQRNTESFGATSVRFTSIPVMGIANVHLAPVSMPKLDLYAGLSAGFTRTSVDTDVAVLSPLDEAGTDFSLGLQGGARYSLSQRSSLLLQLGVGDLPFVFAGASFKF
ncbi:MAG: hypothetical protein V4617_12440 [Gemmatimonadota bacterium]